MTLNIELSSDKISRLNEHARLIGMSSAEFVGKIIELIADSSNDEMESWLETMEILSDKDFAARLKASINQAEKGRLTDWQEAKRELELV